MDGNTSNKTTLRQFLDKIENQYGKAQRVWIMDRGIPTEDILTEMRQCKAPVYYLVGTPKGRLNKLEKELLPLPWAEVHKNLTVKLLKPKIWDTHGFEKLKSGCPRLSFCPSLSSGSGSFCLL